MTDRYLIEHNSDVRFDRDSVTAKLAALLNSHSPEQVRARPVESSQQVHALWVSSSQQVRARCVASQQVRVRLVAYSEQVRVGDGWLSW